MTNGFCGVAIIYIIKAKERFKAGCDFEPFLYIIEL